MRILLLHPNFPGQLVRPALLLAKQGHEVIFLCHTHYGRSLPNVKRITLKRDLGEDELNKRKLSGHLKAMAMAEQFLEGMEHLKNSGWTPDIVISHSGFGCGTYSTYVWPSAHKIAYVEWWFAEDAAIINYDLTNKWWTGPGKKANNKKRNLCMALELCEANVLVSPTNWQKSQLPKSLQDRCIVFHDGVDRNRFAPNPDLISETPLLTYGTRGMEPMRGFPEFIEELPSIMDKYPLLKVEIAGEDQVCYGGSFPSEGTYGSWAKNYLEKWIENKRIIFTGRLSPSEYVQWLQRSWFHFSLTRPYVASWSLLEAMASGCCIIASDTQPVKEFLDKETAILIDHRVDGWLLPTITKLIDNPKIRKSLSTKARVQSSKWSEANAFNNWSKLFSYVSEDPDIDC